MTGVVVDLKMKNDDKAKALEAAIGQMSRTQPKPLQGVHGPQGRRETADAVIDAAKQFALDRRKEQAKTTKAATSQWKKEQAKNTADHLKQARQNRAEAEATRAHTKKLREEIVKKRQKEAERQREAPTKPCRLALRSACLPSPSAPPGSTCPHGPTSRAPGCRARSLRQRRQRIRNRRRPRISSRRQRLRRKGSGAPFLRR